MYALLRDLALRVMKAPTEPPEPPAGSGAFVQIYRASPKFLTYRLLGFWLLFSGNWLIVWGIFVAGLITREGPPIVIALILAPALAVVQFCVYFSIHIDYDMRYYVVTDRSLRVREGAFIVKEKTISFANVQNIRVVQGPLLRLFGIRNLQVDTAGGGASEQGQAGSNAHCVQMAGIENAHEVRDMILAQLRARPAGTGLGDPDDADDGAPRLPQPTPELRRALGELKQATAELRAVSEAR